MKRLPGIVIAALLAILLLVPRGYASGYGYAQQQVILTPQVVAVPTAVALFQYAAHVTTPPPVILSPSLLASHEQREQALAAEVARLRAAVKQLQERQIHGENPHGEIHGPPRIADVEGPPIAMEKPAVSREQLIVRAAQIAQAKCVMCHSGTTARGDVALFNAAGAFEPNVSWDEIYRSLTRKRNPMPKGQPPLNEEERQIYFALTQQQSAP